jgi:hypothetical protein
MHAFRVWVPGSETRFGMDRDRVYLLELCLGVWLTPFTSLPACLARAHCYHTMNVAAHTLFALFPCLGGG